MAYNYRCSLRRTCGLRRTLPKPIEDYVYEPKCKGCGGRTLSSVNKKEKLRNKRRVCNCDGYHYPHHIGTAPWCIESSREPTEEEHRERYER